MILCGLPIVFAEPEFSNTHIGTRRVPDSMSLREGQGLATDAGLYVMGGFLNGFRGMTNRSFLYPYTSNPTLPVNWIELAPVPIDGGITHCGQVHDTVTNEIYYVGGFQVPTGAVWPHANTISTFFRYSIDTDSWSTGPDLPLPRGAGAIAIHRGVNGDKLHHFGGATLLPGHKLGDHTEHWILDLSMPRADQRWVQAASAPTPRNHFGAVEFGGYIYIIGGQIEEKEVWDNLDIVEKYDPVNDRFYIVSPMPSVQGHITPSIVAVPDGHGEGGIMVVGGFSDGRTTPAIVHYYKPNDDEWCTLSSPFGGGESRVSGYSRGRLYSFFINKVATTDVTFVPGSRQCGALTDAPTTAPPTAPPTSHWSGVASTPWMQDFMSQHPETAQLMDSAGIVTATNGEQCVLFRGYDFDGPHTTRVRTANPTECASVCATTPGCGCVVYVGSGFCYLKQTCGALAPGKSGYFGGPCASNGVPTTPVSLTSTIGTSETTETSPHDTIGLLSLHPQYSNIGSSSTEVRTASGACLVFAATDFYGNDIGSTSAATQADCADDCSENAACSCFSHNARRGTCYLKSNCGASSVRNAHTAGPCFTNAAIAQLVSTTSTMMSTRATTQSPTLSPSAVPTSRPSDIPTNSPTLEPTTFPTPSPTSSPTTVPTTAPTSVPTSLPTLFPTVGPTSSPTQMPTSNPTSLPTGASTQSPSNQPTVSTEPSSTESTASVNPESVVTSTNPTTVPAESSTSFMTWTGTSETPNPTTTMIVDPTDSATQTSETPQPAPSSTPTMSPSYSPTQGAFSCRVAVCPIDCAALSVSGCGWSSAKKRCTSGGFTTAAEIASNICAVSDTSTTVNSTAGDCSVATCAADCAVINGCGWSSGKDRCVLGGRTTSRELANSACAGSVVLPSRAVCRAAACALECSRISGCGWSSGKSRCVPGGRTTARDIAESSCPSTGSISTGSLSCTQIECSTDCALAGSRCGWNSTSGLCVDGAGTPGWVAGQGRCVYRPVVEALVESSGCGAIPCAQWCSLAPTCGWSSKLNRCARNGRTTLSELTLGTCQFWA